MPLPPSCDRRHLLQLGPLWNAQWRRRCSRKEALSSPTPGPSYLARGPLHHQGTSSRARKSSKRQPRRQPERIANLTRMFEPAMSHMDGQESIDATCALLDFPLQFFSANKSVNWSQFEMRRHKVACHMCLQRLAESDLHCRITTS